MQTRTHKNCIKVTQTGKGQYHWEDQLLTNQRKRLQILLCELEVDPWKTRKILQLHNKQCTRDNIIALHSHTIEVYLSHLLNQDITPLLNSSTIKNMES